MARETRNRKLTTRTAVARIALAALLPVVAVPAFAATCVRTLTADVVAFDQPLMYNRLGASNVNGMMYALQARRHQRRRQAAADRGRRGDAGPGRAAARQAARVRWCCASRPATACTVHAARTCSRPRRIRSTAARSTATGVPPFALIVDDQVADRNVGFHVNGMQVVNSIDDDSQRRRQERDRASCRRAAASTYTLYAEKEGVFLVQSDGATFGADANQGNAANGLFGQVIVEPKGARIYRSQVTEEEMRLVDAPAPTRERASPIINYEATYPTTHAVDRQKARPACRS